MLSNIGSNITFGRRPYQESANANTIGDILSAIRKYTSIIHDLPSATGRVEPFGGSTLLHQRIVDDIEGPVSDASMVGRLVSSLVAS